MPAGSVSKRSGLIVGSLVAVDTGPPGAYIPVARRCHGPSQPAHLHQRRDCGRRGGLVGRVPVSRPGLAAGADVRAGVGRAPDHVDGERAGPARGRHEAGNPGDDAALQAGPDRHQARLRPRRVRRLHRAHRRRAALFMLGAYPHGAHARRHDHRGPGESLRRAAPGAARRGGGAGLPVRLLHAGVRDGGRGLPESESQPDA